MSFELELKDYKVKQGDTAYSIAKKYGMTVGELSKRNKLKNAEVIKPGQVLNVGDEVKISTKKTKNVQKSNSVKAVAVTKTAPKGIQSKRDYSKVKANSLYDVAKITGLPLDYIRFLREKENMFLTAQKGLSGAVLIGVGHNCDLKKDYKAGDKISPQTAYTLLARDLLFAKDKLHKALNGKKLPAGQEAAAIDLMFNVGESVLNSKFMSHIKNGDFHKAVGEIDYIYTNGTTIHPGLCIRRIENVIQFCGGKLNPTGKKQVNRLLGNLKSTTKNQNIIKEVETKIAQASGETIKQNKNIKTKKKTGNNNLSMTEHPVPKTNTNNQNIFTGFLNFFSRNAQV